MSTLTNMLLDAALDYRCMGGQVFPCHPTGHQPLVERGFYAATCDENAIRSWWSRWPRAAIGLRTGEATGMFALDIDPRNGGDVALEHLEAEHGELPESVESRTGGGGRHVLLNWPDRPVRCSTGQIGAGIDVKGDGGYIILPPSDHASGRQYCWLIGQEPGNHEIADAPAWLLEMIGEADGPGAGASTAAVGDEIPEGYRNTTLTSQAGHMRQIGMTAEEIAPAFQAVNVRRCRPPLDACEVERIARSIGRYDPDTASQALTEGWDERYLGDGTNWPEPQPIPEDLPVVKALDPVLLPATLRPWVVDIAERMQCPIEFPAASAMVALAGMVGRRAAIRPMQRDDWTEYPNLWGMLIGRPSLMKSPPMKQVLMPIRRLTEAAREEHRAAMKVYERQVELASIEAKQAKRKVEAALDKGEDVEALSDSLLPDRGRSWPAAHVCDAASPQWRLARRGPEAYATQRHSPDDEHVHPPRPRRQRRRRGGTAGVLGLSAVQSGLARRAGHASDRPGCRPARKRSCALRCDTDGPVIGLGAHQTG